MERFRVEVIAKTLNPQQVVYAALHQDYTENFVVDDRDSWPSEENCGEVIVKRLLAGDRGHYGCYDDATEVLTQTGWKQWSDVTSSDALAAVDISTNSIHFEKPEKLQKYWHDGFMYHVQGQAVDLLVTLDHRMVVSHRHKDGSWTENYFSEAKNVLGKPRRYLVAANFIETSRVKFNNPWEIDPVVFAKLLGFFISDGSAEKLGDQIRFHLKKQRKIDYLNSLGLNVEAKKSDKYVVNLPGAGAWFKERCYKDNQKCLPQEFLLVTKDEIEGILDGLINGDGNIRENGAIRFASTSVTLLDQIQALLCINGYTSGWSINHQESELHSQGIYLSIHNRLHPRVETSQEGRSRTYSESIKDYSGYVYCASVSTGALMVRRNKKPVVCGNCLEHPQIVFNCGYFPHSVMQQARTHRVGVSFDVQCLAADTAITFVNCEGETNKKLKKTIGELYDLWTNGEKAIRQRLVRGRNGETPDQYRHDCQKKIRQMRLRVLNEETNLFEVGHIKNVMCSGLQPIYRVTLEDGKTLHCTVNHRLFTSEGWQTLGEAVGLVTASDGSVVAMTKTGAVMCNGLTLKDTKFRKGNQPWNDKPDAIYRNQAWLEEQLAKERHADAMAELANCSIEGRKLRAHPVKVKDVEYLGQQMTYDLEVEGDWHNFVANGMVVHNSFRYTGVQVIDVVTGKKDVEDVFYLRPVGYYSDRQGKKYYYSPEQREADLQWCLEAAKRYQLDIEAGMAEEHARGKLPFDYRQHFVVSFNLRSVLHFCDLRNKKNAQLEIQKLCELMWPHIKEWTPAVAEWYENNRLGKARLAP